MKYCTYVVSPDRESGNCWIHDHFHYFDLLIIVSFCFPRANRYPQHYLHRLRVSSHLSYSQEEINVTFHCSRHWHFTCVLALVISQETTSCFYHHASKARVLKRSLIPSILVSPYYTEKHSHFSWQLTQSGKEDFIYSTKIHHNSDLFLWTRARFGGNVHYMLKANNLMKSVVSLPPHPKKVAVK